MPVPKDPPFKFDPDLSMSWREHLERIHQLGASSVTGPRHPLVFEVNVQSIRQVRFGPGEFAFRVGHSPQGFNPVECAHASVYWPSNLDKVKREMLRVELAHRMFLCHGQPSA